MRGCIAPGSTCGPGNYFYVEQVSCGDGCTRLVATGDQLRITGDLTFDGGAFGDFHLFGGLNIGRASVSFGPGRSEEHTSELQSR